MNELRRVERLIGESTYEEIYFYELKKGNLFKMWEPTGELVLWDDEAIFYANSDAYELNGLWTVDAVKESVHRAIGNGEPIILH